MKQRTCRQCGKIHPERKHPQLPKVEFCSGMCELRFKLVTIPLHKARTGKDIQL